MPRSNAPVSAGIEPPAPSPMQPGLLPTAKTLLGLKYPTEKQSPDFLPLKPGDPVITAQQFDLGVDYHPPGTIEDGEGLLHLEEVLAGGEHKQRIDFSVGLRVDRDVPLALSPPQVARRMRPADPSVDELGVVERLRMHQAASENAALQLEYDPSADPAEVLAAAQEHERQLDRELRKVRQAQKKLLETRLRAIEERVAEARRDGVPAWRLHADAEFRQLHDLRRRLARVNARLAGGDDA